MRRLRWDLPRQEPRSKRPYRDTALVYLGFAVVIVVVAVATGGSLVNALIAAVLFWAAATAYGIVSIRRRQRGRGRELP